MPAEAAFAALAEPRRRAMLMLVRIKPRCVNEIASHFEISQQSVSQHLHVLKDAGLVAVRPDGQRRLYMIRLEGLEEVEDYLAKLHPRPSHSNRRKNGEGKRPKTASTTSRRQI
jgi:DNA-binding transcriptional ArsR family regulator